jgi:hypothetical protein
VTRSPLGALGEHAAAVRASRANGFALVGSASRDPGHSLLTRERRPAGDGGSGGLVWPSAGGGVLPLDPLHLSLGVPDVSRLCPVQGQLSKARVEKGFPAHSKAIERLFGRGRQSANPRITGGLVSLTRANGGRGLEPFDGRQPGRRAVVVVKPRLDPVRLEGGDRPSPAGVERRPQLLLADGVRARIGTNV